MKGFGNHDGKIKNNKTVAAVIGLIVLAALIVVLVLSSRPALRMMRKSPLPRIRMQ